MKNTLTYLGLFLFGGAVIAQTSNEGMLYVADGTQFSSVETLENLETGKFYNDGESYVYSHFNNDGEVDYYQNTGTLHFVGNADQVIGGTHTSFLNNVRFNNRSNQVPFLLTGKLDISGIANFSSGIVDNRNFGGSIIFRGPQAAHVNTSNQSFVDGSVEKLGGTEFVFPIGDGGQYRSAVISTSGLGGDVALYKGSFRLGNSDMQYSHDLKVQNISEIDSYGYWVIEELSASGQDVLISLTWDHETTPLSLISAAERGELSIVRWDEASNKWIDEGGAANIGEQSVTTSVNQYGVFSLARVSAKSDIQELVVYNAVTPNGDGVNDYLEIDIPSGVSNIRLMVFDQWGAKVYESTDYGVNGNLFDGTTSNGITVNGSKNLPTGTYYYILDYGVGNSPRTDRQKQAGFLYLNRD